MQVFTETKRIKKDGFKAWGAYDDCQQPESYIEGCAGLEADPDGEDVDLTVFQRSGFGKGGKGGKDADVDA